MSPITSSPRATRTAPHRSALRIAVAWLVVLLSLATAIAVTAWFTSAASSETSFPLPAPARAAVLGADDGVVPESESVGVESDLPAITRLDPALRDALRAAGDSAAADDLTLDITSGWRSAAYQEQLFNEAVVTYGSEEAARVFVAPADGSRHVTGDAVDIGSLDAQLWLMEHGWEYGLCQTYANERWHFELATTPGGTCPDMRTDATDDWSR